MAGFVSFSSTRTAVLSAGLLPLPCRGGLECSTARRDTAGVVLARRPVQRRCNRLNASKSGWNCLDDSDSDEFEEWSRHHDPFKKDSTRPTIPYKRVMLKISGEALQGDLGFGIDPGTLASIAREVRRAVRWGVQVAIVVGGGNYFRGASAWDGLERATADYVGMLATCMNAIALQSALEGVGIPTRVQTAIQMREIAEPYIRRRAIRHLEKGRVVIFGGGTGNPFFTTDTAAALRAAEVGAEAFFKATKVDGVYDRDPVRDPHAVLHRHISYRDVMTHNLQVMDETAITLCKENNIPVVVFNLTTPGNITRALTGDPEIGTTVDETGDWDCDDNASSGSPASTSSPLNPVAAAAAASAANASGAAHMRDDSDSEEEDEDEDSDLDGDEPPRSSVSGGISAGGAPRVGSPPPGPRDNRGDQLAAMLSHMVQMREGGWVAGPDAGRTSPAPSQSFDGLSPEHSLNP